jgi:hypothetical protein
MLGVMICVSLRGFRTAALFAPRSYCYCHRHLELDNLVLWSRMLVIGEIVLQARRLAEEVGGVGLWQKKG